MTTTLPIIVHLAADDRNPRRRVRTVSPDAAIRDAATKAAAGKTAYVARHGGDVPNSYGYAASTQAVFAGALAIDGALHVVVYAGELPANKVTYSGVAAMAGYRPLADERYGKQTTDEAWAALRAELRGLAATEPAGDYIAGYVACHGGETAYGATAEEAVAKCCETYEAALAR